MLSRERLEAKYRKRGVVRGKGSLYLNLAASRDFINDCYANDLAVARIEGLILESDGIRPRMDLILDFFPYKYVLPFEDWQGFKDLSQADALSFVEDSAEPDLVYDIFVIDRGVFDQVMAQRADSQSLPHRD